MRWFLLSLSSLPNSVRRGNALVHSGENPAREAKDDQVRYFIITCDTYDVTVHGSTHQTRYKALPSFELGKEFLETPRVP